MHTLFVCLSIALGFPLQLSNGSLWRAAIELTAREQISANVWLVARAVGMESAEELSMHSLLDLLLIAGLVCGTHRAFMWCFILSVAFRYISGWFVCVCIAFRAGYGFKCVLGVFCFTLVLFTLCVSDKGEKETSDWQVVATHTHMYTEREREIKLLEASTGGVLVGYQPNISALWTVPGKIWYPRPLISTSLGSLPLIFELLLCSGFKLSLRLPFQLPRMRRMPLTSHDFDFYIFLSSTPCTSHYHQCIYMHHSKIFSLFIGFIPFLNAKYQLSPMSSSWMLVWNYK